MDKGTALGSGAACGRHHALSSGESPSSTSVFSTHQEKAKPANRPQEGKVRKTRPRPCRSHSLLWGGDSQACQEVTRVHFLHSPWGWSCWWGPNAVLWAKTLGRDAAGEAGMLRVRANPLGPPSGSGGQSQGHSQSSGPPQHPSPSPRAGQSPFCLAKQTSLAGSGWGPGWGRGRSGAGSCHCLFGWGSSGIRVWKK